MSQAYRTSRIATILTLACASPALALSSLTWTVNPAQPASATNYTTIQSAIDAIPAGNLTPTTIQIAPGTYDERVLVPAGKEYVTLQGMGATNAGVVMTAHDWMGGPNGWEGSQPLRAYANNFQASNLTLQNTWGDNGQATALRTKGDKQIFNNVVLDGWQDTFLAEGGRQYFINSEVRGRVDFIYGPANLVFDHSNIVSRNGGHVTAASTPAANPFGITFLNSTLNWDHSAPYAQADLGRPWGPYAAVAYINTWMDSHILPAGWNDWGNVDNQSTARYSEYNTTGPGANPGARVSWSHQLTAQEAAAYTVTNIFSGWDPLNTPMVPVSWTGAAGDVKWTSANNWDTTQAPKIGQNLYITPSSSTTVTVDGTAVGDQLSLGKTGTPSNLSITSTGALNVSGLLQLDGGSTITIDGGSLTVATLNIPTVGNTNQVILKNNGTLNVANWTGAWGPCGSLIINKGTFASLSMGGAEVKMAPNVGDSATINIRPGDAWPGVRFISTGAGTSVINQTGGSVNGVYGPYLGDTGGGTATYNISGGTAYWLDPVLGKNYAGTFTVNQSAGTVNALGATGTQYSYNDGIIKIGDKAGSVAAWNVSGTAALNHRAINVAGSGNGTLLQTGGAVTIDQPLAASTKGTGLKIGTGSSTGAGLYEISAGALLVKNGGLSLGYNYVSGGGITPANAKGKFKVDGGASSISITGDYNQNAGSTLAAQLQSNGLSTLAITGNVSFVSGALLDISALPGAPVGTYNLMTWTGTLSGAPTLTGATDPLRFFFTLNAAAKTLSITSLLPGDANTDGNVDLADYDLWYKHVGTLPTSIAAGDFNRDGNIDLSDYDVWYTHVGSHAPLSPTPELQPAPIPEPASLALLAATLPLLLRRRR